MSDRRRATYVLTPELPEANALEVTVRFETGGINYMNYAIEKKGYYAGVAPVTIEKSNGFTGICYENMVTNPRIFKVLLAEAPRFNRKTLDALATRVLPKAADLITPLAALDRETVALKLREAAAA